MYPPLALDENRGEWGHLVVNEYITILLPPSIVLTASSHLNADYNQPTNL